ncbi:MAG: hypothetical protein WCR06_04800 [bacterium]
MNVIFTLEDVLLPVARALRLTAAADMALAVSRIDVLHRELCGLAPWPALRAVAQVTTTGQPVALAAAVGISSVTGAAGEVFWFAERADTLASELGGRLLWSLGMPARNDAGALLFDLWDWDDDTDARVAATGGVVSVAYWKTPGTLAVGTDRLALPSTRALVVRAVLDLVGLMDRKDADVAAWRGEMDSSMQELRSLLPVAGTQQVLRLPSGRVLTRGPSR